MGRPCTICRHTHRAAIDGALVAGYSFRDIAAQYGISKTALHRHWQLHLVETPAPQPSAPYRPTGTPSRPRGTWGWWVAGILGVLFFLGRAGNAGVGDM